MREDGTSGPGNTGGGAGSGGFGGGFGGRGKFFDDLAGVASGAFSVVAGLRAEMEAMARAQTEAMISRLELVRREELDAALEVARRAREEVEALSARVAALESARPAPATPTYPRDYTGDAGGGNSGDSGSGGADGSSA